MTYPNQPQQPGPPYGYAPQGQPPAPPKKSNVGKILGFGCLGIIGLFVLIGIIAAVASGGGDDGTSPNAAKPVTVTEPTEKDTEKDEPKEPAKEPAEELSQAEQFKAFVAKNGTATEKDAVKHVTKVQGADEQNDILDAAEVFTDYTGGLIGPHGKDGKLIASAFADWKSSENGLVTVYDKDGEILSNGNF